MCLRGAHILKASGDIVVEIIEIIARVRAQTIAAATAIALRLCVYLAPRYRRVFHQ